MLPPDALLVPANERQPWPPALRGVRAAFVFLTRLPVGGFPYRPADWRWAPAYFPLVGACLGLALGVCFMALRGLSAWVAALLAVAAGMVLTGAFHEDGLADSCDGLGGAHGGKQALEIMRDSRIGTYGAAALCCSIMLRAAAMTEMPAHAPAGLLLSHTLGRIGPVVLLARLPYLSPHGKGSAVAAAGAVQAWFAAVTGATTLVVVVYAAGLPAQLIWVLPPALALVSWLAARYFLRVLGGINGDCLGATEQVAELVTWLVLLASVQHAGH